jgi:hypothetical protein
MTKPYVRPGIMTYEAREIFAALGPGTQAVSGDKVPPGD